MDQAESGSFETFKNGAPPKSDCAKISYDSLQKKILVDFGPSNCLGGDKRLRRGRLEAHILRYGNGLCDNDADIRIKGEFIHFSLR